MTDDRPSPPADEEPVPLVAEPAEPAADGWPGFPPAAETEAPWATAVMAPESAPAPAPPPAPARRLWTWVAVGVGLQVLALFMWAYFVL
jgi:hypothetical protein